MKFRKKPVVIDATQWFRNGDHPLDHLPIHEGATVSDREHYDDYLVSEGKIVRRFRRPDVSGDTICADKGDRKGCGNLMSAHGWIDTLEGGHIVCPGDFIITGVKGERYPCKPDIFAQTYDAVEANG